MMSSDHTTAHLLRASAKYTDDAVADICVYCGRSGAKIRLSVMAHEHCLPTINTRGCEPMNTKTAEALAQLFKAAIEQYRSKP